MAAAQVTFEVEGRGTSLTKIALFLQPGAGVNRPAMLASARVVQRALNSTGFFAVAIRPPSPLGSRVVPNEPALFPVTVSARQTSANVIRVNVGVAVDGLNRQNHRRAFEVSDGTSADIGYAVANILYEYFLSREGYFSDRLLYVERYSSGDRPTFRIVSSDIFGENKKVHVKSRTELVSPRLTPDGKTLVYTAILNARPRLVTRSMAGGVERSLFKDSEIRFSPEIGLDGFLYYTKVVNGNSDIYRIPLNGGREQRLTTSPSIETEPSVSADGQLLAYVSDQAGLRLFVHSLSDGSKRIVGERSGNYGSPAWSPDGKSLAVSIFSDGNFSIAIIDMETNEEKILSNSFFEEQPTWARNGRVIVFERGGRGGRGESTIWQVDTDTQHVQLLPVDTSPRDPIWIR